MVDAIAALLGAVLGLGTQEAPSSPPAYCADLVRYRDVNLVRDYDHLALEYELNFDQVELYTLIKVETERFDSGLNTVELVDTAISALDALAAIVSAAMPPAQTARQATRRTDLLNLLEQADNLLDAQAAIQERSAAQLAAVSASLSPNYLVALQGAIADASLTLVELGERGADRREIQQTLRANIRVIDQRLETFQRDFRQARSELNYINEVREAIDRTCDSQPPRSTADQSWTLEPGTYRGEADERQFQVKFDGARFLFCISSADSDARLSQQSIHNTLSIAGSYRGRYQLESSTVQFLPGPGVYGGQLVQVNGTRSGLRIRELELRMANSGTPASMTCDI